LKKFIEAEEKHKSEKPIIPEKNFTGKL